MQRSSVDGIFLGRDRQLSDFDRFLATFLSTVHPAPRPQIILISGQGGIGKTTLLRAFQDRLGPEGPFRPALLDIDWHEEQKQAPHDASSRTTRGGAGSPKRDSAPTASRPSVVRFVSGLPPRLSLKKSVCRMR